ncbi:MAG: hypothetical protein EON88_36790, partial [Brevundimonas sp.]
MTQDTVVPLRALRCIVVSHEMTIIRGRGPLEPTSAPDQPIALSFDMSASSPSLTVAGADHVADVLAQEEGGVRVVLLLAPEVVGKIDGSFQPGASERRDYYLPSELRAIALAVRDCERHGGAGEIYLGAKGIELLYETWAALDAGSLTPMAAGADLTQADSQRIAAALNLIESRWLSAWVRS